MYRQRIQANESAPSKKTPRSSSPRNLDEDAVDRAFQYRGKFMRWLRVGHRMQEDDATTVFHNGVSKIARLASIPENPRKFYVLLALAVYHAACSHWNALRRRRERLNIKIGIPERFTVPARPEHRDLLRDCLDEPRFTPFTKQEKDVWALVADGHSYEVVAAELGTSAAHARDVMRRVRIKAESLRERLVA